MKKLVAWVVMVPMILLVMSSQAIAQSSLEKAREAFAAHELNDAVLLSLIHI